MSREQVHDEVQPDEHAVEEPIRPAVVIPQPGCDRVVLPHEAGELHEYQGDEGGDDHTGATFFVTTTHNSS